MSWKRIAMALILAGLACALKAQEPRRLADINVGALDPIGDDASRVAGGLVPFGDRLIFAIYGTGADDGSLWSSDGTPAGTAPLPVALCPAPCELLAPVGVVQGGALLEVRSNASGLHTTRLWRTDGTAAGTFPLTRSIGFIEERIVLDDLPRGLAVLYFTACRDLDSCQLWRTDGSRAGTQIVRDFHEGNSSHGPHAFHLWNGRLVFIADDGNRAALWITDGSSEGTVRLAPIPDDERGTFFTQAIAATPSRLFFTSGYLSELWVTDGTPEGTRRLRVFKEAVCPNHYYCENAYTDALVPFGEEVYFTAAEPDDASGKVEIWKSDGTEEGTVRVTRMPPLTNADRPFAATLRRTGGRWFFLTGPYWGTALWESDGDLAAAAPVTDCEGGCPREMTFLGDPDAAGRQLFQATDDAHGTELWVTDGTGPGTRLLADACPGPCSGINSGDSFLGSFPGGTYFQASSQGVEGAKELWVTDGTPGGTRRVTGTFSRLASFQGSTWFSTFESETLSTGLWRTDGTPAGTRRAIDLQLAAPGSSPVIFPRRGGGALMLVWDGTSRRLWHSDGTPQGPVPLGGITLDPELDDVYSDPLQVGPLQFFGVIRQKGDPDDLKVFYELWRTDGTTRGTFRLLDLNGDRFFWDLPATWNGKFLFEVEDGGHCAFWTSDGTPDGTRELFPLRADSRCALAVHPLGSGFLFLARVPGGHGRELTPQLFFSDGTAAGTRQISRITGDRGAYGDFIAAGGTVLFQILDRKGEPELWRTDGTPGGTKLVRDILPGPGSSLPAELTTAGGKVFFSAHDGIAGREPWALSLP